MLAGRQKGIMSRNQLFSVRLLADRERHECFASFAIQKKAVLFLLTGQKKGVRGKRMMGYAVKLRIIDTGF